MENPRLKGLVDRFAIKKKIEGEFSYYYQLFCNSLILKQRYYEVNWEFPYDSYLDLKLLQNIDLDNNKEKSMAVDGFFAIFNKQIIHLNLEEKEFEEIFNNIQKGILEIVFIQSKSGNLETSSLSTLSDCLTTKFNSQSSWKKLLEFRSKCEKSIQKNPTLKIKFTTYFIVGNSIEKNIFENPTFQVREKALISSMKEYFWITDERDVCIKYFSGEEVFALYEEQSLKSNRISKTVNLVEMTKEIECCGNRKIRFGAISFGELMKIIYDKDSKKPNDIYGYNVRGEIEDSPVNEKIIDSIKNSGENFLLLNNGITIVVDKQERKGDSGIYLEDIRIVNGCQTSHSILNSCAHDDKYDNLIVPFKIIQIKDDSDDILGDITYCSNYQNSVQKDNLLAIDPKMFQLERLYKDFELTNKTVYDSIYFERRQGQFNNQPIEFLDMLAQAKAFLSMWNKKTHFAAMYKDICLNEYLDYMENDTNFLNKSLISGVLWYNIYKFIPALFDNARYHIFSAIVLFELERELCLDNILETNQNEFNEATNCLTIGILDKWKINIEQEVMKVVHLIQENEYFTISSKSGKIPYRMFYKVDALKTIYNDYKSHKLKE